MKLKYTFVINEVAGQTVAVPIDAGSGEQSIIKTNETGAFILNLLKDDISFLDILDRIKAEYQIDDEKTLENWVNTFITKLKSAGVLIDE